MNKYEKEQLVIRLHEDGKTIREIASAAHISFGDIGKVIKKIDGQADNGDTNITKITQAIFLFKSGNKPIDVAIKLDISAGEIEDILQEYWVLNQLDDLALAYYEIKHHLDLFLKLFRTLKKNKSINQKDIGRLLRYAVYDLPSLEAKIQRLTSDIVDLESRKKRSRDELDGLRFSISQLKKQLNWHQMEIGLKKEIISNLDRQLSQKSHGLEEKLSAHTQ